VGQINFITNSFFHNIIVYEVNNLITSCFRNNMFWTVCLDGGPRRVNHAAVTVGERVYSFGGYCTGEDYKEARPMDIYVLQTATLRWFAMPLPTDSKSDNVPFQRYGHTAVAHGNCAYIWGGRNDLHACNKLYCYDTVTGRWTRVVTTGQTPRARDGHSACVINNRMYIFGGYEEDFDRFTQDVHALDFETMTWYYVVTKSTPPKWRDFHSACAIGHYMYIFGGRGDRQGPYHSPDEDYCNQIMYLDTASRTWHTPKTLGSPPSGRRSHSAFVYKGQLYIFGGYNGLNNCHYGDMYKYDPLSTRWTIVKIWGKGPCARRRHGCCMVGDKLYIFGGTSPYPSGVQPPPSLMLHMQDGIDPSLMDHNDLYVLDFAPTLKTLCKMVIIKHGLDASCLPYELRWEIGVMTTNNTISRPLNNSG